MTAGATAQVAAFASGLTSSEVPPVVLHEATRCFLNFTGCAIGGTGHELVPAIEQALLPWSGPALANLIGRNRRADPLLAALMNGSSASAHSFDDTHAQAIVHPGAPVGAAALALAQSRYATGTELVLAMVAGVETACRLSRAISVPPAEIDIAWYQTGVSGGAGAAAAAGRLLGLDADAMTAAIGIAVSQASGTRIMQGSMSMLMLAGHAAQCGLRAALLAARGVGSPVDSLEGRYGFAEAFSIRGNPGALTDGLGSRYELLANVYKPYPCGVVLQPVIDACLALRARQALDPGTIERVIVRVNPVALALADRRHPSGRTQAQVSLHHWTVMALVRGKAGLAEGTPAAIAEPAIVDLRDRVDPVGDAQMRKDSAEVTVQLHDGTRHVATGDRALAAPMTDAELDRKFREQALGVYPAERVETLLELLRRLPALDSVEVLGRHL